MISYDPIFKLQQPYNLDKTITLTFSSPNNNITFNDDNYLVYVEYTNPAIITIYSNNIDPILPLNFLSNISIIILIFFLIKALCSKKYLLQKTN